MKQKVILSFLLAFLAFSLSAQSSVVTSSFQLNWRGVQLWKAGDYSKKVIDLESAVYIDENLLPWLNKRIDADLAFEYAATVNNAVYVPVPKEESEIVLSALIPTDQPKVRTSVLSERGNGVLDVNVFPFVMRDGQLLKIKSFDLAINKTASAQKSKTATRHTYAPNSVLADGKFVKIRIVNSGIYKLTYEDLSSMGISPANVRIFGYGGAMLEQSFLIPKPDDLPEVTIHMEKGSDGVFNAGDYILFYAQGINKWKFDSSINLFTHTINPYSNYGYYFVSSDKGVGKKIEQQSTTPSDDVDFQIVEEFTDYSVYEKESRSLAQSGKEFYGDYFSDSNPKSITFNFPNSVLTSTAKVRIDVAANASVASSFYLLLEDAQRQTLMIPKRSEDTYEKGKGASAVFAYTPVKDVFNFNLSYSKPNSIASGYLNYIEVNTRRYLKMSGSVMQFQNVDNLGFVAYKQYQLSNASPKIQIWNITDPLNIYRVQTQTENGLLTFTESASEINHYIAIDPTAATAFSKPEIVGTVVNQNLHALAQVEMVILTHPKFLKQAETLAQAHRDIDGMTVEVVTTEQVYNEFSSGAPDATAYRWVMKMLYDRALASGNAADMPKYLLLFGRGTYDNRKLTNESGENLILTYQAENSLVQTQSYVTDDYFGFLDDNEGLQPTNHLVDIGIGRFPVTTVDEAQIVVDKTIGYMKNTNKGSWKNQLCFLADDGDGALHMTQSDEVASLLIKKYPSYQLNKIYLDSYNQEKSASGESYPLARTHFHDLLRNGLLYLNFTGHASNTGWTNEKILTVNDVKSLTNQQLPLWLGATCDFLQFDLKAVSAGEHVLLNPYGGGIGIFSAARPVYASQNHTINLKFSEYLFKRTNGQHNRIGDVVAYAKNNVGAEFNKLSYVYMGDPAVKLNFPTDYNVSTTKIDDGNELGNDTLRAMSVVTVSGIIDDGNGNKIQNFNGELTIVVLDKVQRITTLNNHGDGAMTYSDRPNTLFSGRALVKDGEFSVTFMLPKDIKYNYGTGRINYYAYDKTNEKEAQGYYENFTVGGTNKDVVADTTGPEMKLYMNSENFRSGGKVNETPMFIAHLSDVNGINRVGSGIGHDLLLIVDNDPRKSYVINDYYQTAENDYTKGVVKYKLPELEAGKHTLTFRAWDLLNNSSVQSLEFEAVKGLTPTIFGINNYPNPVIASTRIVVDHDRPETILSTKVDIFDLSGRQIWSFSQANADEINWNLIRADGKKANAGIYLYRVTISTKNSDTYSKSNKMIIVE